jgi:RNA polymerase sigma-70 factor (ECF subfamily)
MNHLEHRGIRQKHAVYTVQQGSDVQPPEVFPEELGTAIAAAIDSLPEQCRLIFRMSRYEEMKYSEIARRLEISVNTVENQVSKALKLLRARLDVENV